MVKKRAWDAKHTQDPWLKSPVVQNGEGFTEYTYKSRDKSSGDATFKAQWHTETWGISRETINCRFVEKKVKDAISLVTLGIL